MQLGAFELFDAGHAQRAGLEGAHAGGDDYDLAEELGALVGFNVKKAVFALFHHADFLTEVEGGVEGVNLLEKVFREFVGGIHGHGRDVIDRLGGIQFHALAADVFQRVDDVSLYFEKAELENLKKPHGAGTDDHGVGFNDLVGGFGNVQIIFNSHSCRLSLSNIR